MSCMPLYTHIILVLFSSTHKVPDNSCSKTVSQNMPDPVRIILFHATEWEMFLQNLRRVVDFMEGKILASNPIPTVAPHALIPVLL